MAKKQFKAESKRLLDLMINSIYTHKEIFIRELISNSSDAIDKLYYKSLENNISGFNREDFEINIKIDKEKRELIISDNGIGMNKEELEQNLGTIAKSGSLAFKTENEAKEDIDIIGQFGVGFYSAFMVSDHVTVKTKAYDGEEAFCWESTGADGYKIDSCEKEKNGTEIILSIKENTEEENYDVYLEEYKIKGLVAKYSDYIGYPITMMVEKQREKEGEEGAFESYSEKETLNSMVPIWKRQKSELKDEDYNNFYKEKFFDFVDPQKVIHTSVEGVASYNALMFIPGQTPFDYYTKEYKKGLQLYSSGVLIMEKCEDLLPDYFGFVKGLVDSQDLSLNISREMLQHDRQLKAIAKNLEKKIKSELLNMQKNQREEYDKFFENFGIQIKYGLYEGFGANKETLQDLVMFYSSVEKKMVTFEEYIEKMPEEQKSIYFAKGDSIEKLDRLPQTEVIKEKGYEILYLTDDIDEFTLQTLREYKGKDFKSVSAEDLDLGDSKEEQEEDKEMLEVIKEALGNKVSQVKLSNRLKTHPVCITTKGDVSLEMEKVLKQMPTGQEVKAEKILEINANHEIMKALENAFENDKEKLKDYGNLLYNQALLIEGFSVEDPVEFGNQICKLMK